jgi:hypothetical protein
VLHAHAVLYAHAVLLRSRISTRPLDAWWIHQVVPERNQAQVD